MKQFLFFLIFLCLGPAALAQLNRDQPVTIGSSDKVYRSSADSTVAYVFPIKLETLNEPYVHDIDGEYRIFFDVGVNQDDIKRVVNEVSALNLPLKVRTLRVANVVFDKSGPQQIERRFKARLKPLGDAGDLMGPVPYQLTIRKIGPRKGLESKKVIDFVFRGTRAAHLASFDYEFLALVNGIHYPAKTQISIFAVNNGAPANKILANVPTKPEEPLMFEFDGITKCWDKPRVGTVCLK